jgi:hypothetical protein
MIPNRKVHLDRGDGKPWCYVKAKAYWLGSDAEANCETCFKQRKQAPGPNQLLTCSKCKQEKPGEAFASSAANATGKSAYCRPCHRLMKKAEHKAHPENVTNDSKKYRERHPAKAIANARRHRETFPKAAYARMAIKNAITRGRLSRGPCETCGEARLVHGHHDDYDKPLYVRWLCPRHHADWHQANGPGANIEGEPVLVGDYRKQQGSKHP